MPVYDYECGQCGVFTALRPMSECRDPLQCPACGQEAPRAFVTAPALAGMDGALRKAHAINERAAHEPKPLSRGRGHGPGCACCGASTNGGKRAGAKFFPSRRPWMISH